MSAMVMQAPHRKPVPGYAAPAPAAAVASPAPGLSYTSANERTHTRTRTNSSSVMPSTGQLAMQAPSGRSSSHNLSQQQHQQLQQQHQQQLATQYAASQQSRRTLSTATTSTTSSSLNPNLHQVPSNYSIRRSTSKSSNSSSISPTSYVALMRKQKATVWCDRAQHEDPRILVAQRQAKMRAAAEVAGGHNYATQARATSSSGGVVGGVRSKIRYHGAPKASVFNSANYAGGAGVPMRLSASEVDEDDSDDDAIAAAAAANANYYHASAPRAGSARSSLGSGRRGHGGGGGSYYGGLNSMYSNGSTPPNQSPVDDGMADLPEEQTPGPNDFRGRNDDYFSQPGGTGGSGGSGGEKEENFGVVGGLPKKVEPPRKEEKLSADELRRRGSVDERTMTMSGVRLFVANPDLSD